MGAAARVAAVHGAGVFVVTLRAGAALAAADIRAAQHAGLAAVVGAQPPSAGVGRANVAVVAFAGNIARARLTCAAIAHQRAVHLDQRGGARAVICRGNARAEKAAIHRAANAVVALLVLAALAAATVAALFPRSARGWVLAQAAGLAHIHGAGVPIVAILGPRASSGRGISSAIAVASVAQGGLGLLDAAELGAPAGVEEGRDDAEGDDELEPSANA